MTARRWSPAVLAVLASGALAARCPPASDDDDSAGNPDAAAFGPTGGTCSTPCTVKEDCCQGGLCETGLFHFACNTGACRQLGCVENTDCSALPGSQCASTGAFNLCGLACSAPADCCPPLPPGVAIPDGQDSVTLAVDGGGEATFYRCGAYPQKYLCTGFPVTPADGGPAGVCLRVCTANDDCPGIPVGEATARVDAGFVDAPLGDGGMTRLFQQQCVAVMGPVGQCAKGCLTDADCCGPAVGSACQSFGTRQVCVQGACVSDGCRADAECATKGAGSRCVP